MTADLSARVAMLEAREKARDAALVRFANHLAADIELNAAPANLAYDIEKLQAAPPPPADPPAPDLERVRELLAQIADPNMLATGQQYRNLARQALHLLGSAADE